MKLNVLKIKITKKKIFFYSQFKLVYILAVLNTLSAGFIVPSVRKARARGHGLPQINKHNQQQIPAAWTYQFIDMSAYGLRGDIGSWTRSDRHQSIYQAKTTSSAFYGNNKYRPELIHSKNSNDLRGESVYSDRKLGTYNDNKVLDHTVAPNDDNKVSLYSTITVPSPSTNSSGRSSINIATGGAFKACKRKL